jgi:hypothetical protein
MAVMVSGMGAAALDMESSGGAPGTKLFPARPRRAK